MNLPPAFSFCDTGECAKPKPAKTKLPGKGGVRDDTVTCPPPPAAETRPCAAPCQCELFWAKAEQVHGVKDEDRKWNFAFPDDNGEVIKQDGNDYRCFCAKVVLPNKYPLCDGGSCGGVKIVGKTVSCLKSDKCTADECNCHLFRLKKTTLGSAGGVKGRDNEWEHAAEEGVAIDLDKDYIYRCYCVKT